jgi:arginase
VVGAPVYTLAKYAGMGRAPGALRRSGFLQSLGEVRDFGDAPIPPLEADVTEGRTKNLRHFVLASEIIAKKVSAVERADTLVCIGGECSSTVGVIAGLGIKGKPGMVWMDSHGDFNTPETSPSGYIGGMCLAMACGRGPRLGEMVEASRPLIEEERLIHVGSRALDPPEAETMRASPMGLFTMKSVSLAGASETAARVSKRLEDSSDWIVCHLDVDVLDPKLVPAVNYPTPGGLTSEEVSAVIRRLGDTGKLRVLEVCAYNADLDGDGTSARVITSVLRNSL